MFRFVLLKRMVICGFHPKMGAVHPAAVHAGRQNASGEACPACQGKHVIVMIIDDDGRRFKFRRCRRTALTLDVRGWWFQQSEGLS